MILMTELWDLEPRASLRALVMPLEGMPGLRAAGLWTPRAETPLAVESQETGRAQLSVKTHPFLVETSTVEMGCSMCSQGREPIREALGGFLPRQGLELRPLRSLLL